MGTTAVLALVVDGDPPVPALASRTGGKFYELTRSTDFSGLIDEIGGDIAKQYRLTYRSPRSSYDGTTRHRHCCRGRRRAALATGHVPGRANASVA